MPRHLSRYKLALDSKVLLKEDAGKRQDEVLAWDLPTRLYKWGLVLCIVTAWATNRYATESPYLHKWNGYTVLVLLVFRLLWGICGGTTARFSYFVVNPKRTSIFIRELWAGRGKHYLGHSPIAALMILALMFVIFTQALTGLFSADQDRLIVEGPLAFRLSDANIHFMTAVHRKGFFVIEILAVIHIAANIVYSLVSQRGYIKAMITGRKVRAAYFDLEESEAGSLLKAMACVAAAVAIVLGSIWAFGGSL
jgi:cytochrome b